MADDPVHQGFFQPQMVARGLADNAARPVIQMGDDPPLTGREVADAVSRYTQALRARGVGADTRIAILSGNRVEVLFAGFAAMYAGGVRTALHPMGSVDDYAYVVDDADIDTIIFDAARYGEKVRELRAKAPGLIRFLSFGVCDFADDLTVLAESHTAQPLVAPVVSADDPFVIGYSGGTTGKPKGIIGTYGTAHAMTVIQLAEWEWPAEIRQLLCAPLSHAGAAMFLPGLLRGGIMHVQAGFDPLAVMRAIERHRITCMLMVPTMIYALLDHPRFGEFDLSSLEVVYYGASPMSVARLREGIEKLGPVFFQFYGQAEAPMTVSVLRRAEHDVTDDRRLASCGRPVPWVDVSLLDADGNAVTDGEPGEICVRGPLVMPGYLDKPEQTEEAFRHGWLHTGDVAIRDPGGFLRIVDRAKDMIISGGFNVYPREVEDALASHAAVAAAGVFGVADDHWGEMVTAAVVLRPGAAASAEELIAHVRARKGVVQAPKMIHLLDALPLTPVGKPDKKALRAMFGKVAEPA